MGNKLSNIQNSQAQQNAAVVNKFAGTPHDAAGSGNQFWQGSIVGQISAGAGGGGSGGIPINWGIVQRQGHINLDLWLYTEDELKLMKAFIEDFRKKELSKLVGIKS